MEGAQHRRLVPPDRLRGALALSAAPLPVEVWRIPLDGPPPAADVLSDDERARAARFRFARDRDAYRHAHVATRRLLGAATGRDPAQLVFATGSHGKPELTGEPTCAFNLTHSGALALLAIAPRGPIGVDVEAVRPVPEIDAIAASHFSPAERAALGALPTPERMQGFHRLWTRKEAYIKAIGTGLSHPLDRFTVTLTATEARLVELDGDAEAAARWCVVPVPVPAGYEAALVGAAPAITLTVRDWTG